MAKSKAQNEYAQKYLKNNPEVAKLWMNPQGEFFTDINYANNSLKKDDNGKVDELEVFLSDDIATDKTIVAAKTSENKTVKAPTIKKAAKVIVPKDEKPTEDQSK